MRCACVDIGSNTTRLLVADAEGSELSRVDEQRVFTHLGSGLERDGRIAPARLAQTTAAAAGQVARARELGAERIAVVGTAALRTAINAADLCAEIRAATGLAPRILGSDAEGRLAFAGALAALGTEPGPGPLAVVDVGGGSTEVVRGTVGPGGRSDVEVVWSVPAGSLTLTERLAPGDPPSGADIAALRSAARALVGDAPLLGVRRVLAVGGSATSLGRIGGARLAGGAVAGALGRLGSAPAVTLAEELGLRAERVRLLPAGLALLEATAERAAQGLEIVAGGVREGVVRELAARATDP